MTLFLDQLDPASRLLIAAVNLLHEEREHYKLTLCRWADTDAGSPMLNTGADAKNDILLDLSSDRVSALQQEVLEMKNAIDLLNNPE